MPTPLLLPLPSGSASPSPSPSPSSPPALANVLPNATHEAATSFVDELFERTPLHHLPFQTALKTGFAVVLLLALFWFVRMAFSRLIRRAAGQAIAREERLGNLAQAARILTLAGLMQSIVLYTVGFVFIVAVLSTLSFDLTGLIGAAGVAGVAVGFGAQKIVKDGLTGAFLLLEDQYAVGDYVTIGSVTGTVEDIALRTTRIRDDEGKLWILSNGDVALVCNQSRAPVSGSFDIGIAASADLAHVSDVLEKAFAQTPETLPLAEPPKINGVSAIEAAKTTIKITYKAQTGTRPQTLAPRLREIALNALHQAEISLA